MNSIIPISISNNIGPVQFKFKFGVLPNIRDLTPRFVKVIKIVETLKIATKILKMFSKLLCTI